jgi:hypothetical protein
MNDFRPPGRAASPVITKGRGLCALVLALSAAMSLDAAPASAQNIPFPFANLVPRFDGPCCYNHGHYGHSYRRHGGYAHRAPAGSRRQQAARGQSPGANAPASDNAQTGAGAAPAAAEPGARSSVKSANVNVEASPQAQPPAAVAIPPGAGAPAATGSEGPGTTASNAGPPAAAPPAAPATPSGPGGGSFY